MLFFLILKSAIEPHLYHLENHIDFIHREWFESGYVLLEVENKDEQNQLAYYLRTHSIPKTMFTVPDTDPETFFNVNLTSLRDASIRFMKVLKKSPIQAIEKFLTSTILYYTDVIQNNGK
jgi:hypothetical protein